MLNILKQFIQLCRGENRAHTTETVTFNNSNETTITHRSDIMPSNEDRNSVALNCVEKGFLKKLVNQPVRNTYLAGYWNYKYGIDNERLITKLLDYGYIIITNNIDNVSRLTIPELKNILRRAGLKVSGKKQVLIDRIESNIPKDELRSYITDIKEYYTATEKGFKEIENLPDSITKDIDFEDEVIKLINDGDFNTAYRKVCLWRGKHHDGSIGTNWFDEAKLGADEKNILTFNHIMGKAKGEEKLYRASYLLGWMLGSRYSDIRVLIKRLCGDINEKLLLVSHKAYLESCSLREIYTYKYYNTKYYQILTGDNETVCEKCKKLHGKRFLVSEAKLGVNLPPFCDWCRCTTVPLE